MKKKRLLSPIHPTHSITETTAAVESQKVVTLPTNPPFDKDFFVSMFKHFAADIDKKIAAIDKKIVQTEKIDEKNEEQEKALDDPEKDV
jgi:hypothetical protein